jgi:hypothetical protein
MLVPGSPEPDQASPRQRDRVPPLSHRWVCSLHRSFPPDLDSGPGSAAQSKPAERRGRRATGPKRSSKDRRSAGPPATGFYLAGAAFLVWGSSLDPRRRRRTCPSERVHPFFGMTWGANCPLHRGKPRRTERCLSRPWFGRISHHRGGQRRRRDGGDPTGTTGSGGYRAFRAGGGEHRNSAAHSRARSRSTHHRHLARSPVGSALIVR